MPRPKTGDSSHTPKPRQCALCGLKVLVRIDRLQFKHHFCSKEHAIAFKKNNAFSFPCKVCSKTIKTQPAQLIYRARSTCSLECRRKLIRSRAIERREVLGYTKHQIDRLARYSPEAEAWRKGVFLRDDYTCQVCKLRGGYLEADHIKPWAFFPELRFELSNGRTLCRKCHDKTKMSYKAMREMYAKV